MSRSCPWQPTPQALEVAQGLNTLGERDFDLTMALCFVWVNVSGRMDGMAGGAWQQLALLSSLWFNMVDAKAVLE